MLAAESTIIPAIGAVLVALIGAIALVFANRTAKKRDNQLEQIHVLVNSRLTQALNEIETLKNILVEKDEVLHELNPNETK